MSTETLRNKVADEWVCVCVCVCVCACVHVPVYVHALTPGNRYRDEKNVGIGE